MIKKVKKNKGFVILFAVTLSAILLAIALGVANIALKEVNFSTSAKDTNDSFVAADTGAECALFYDKLVGGSFPIGGPATPLTITCASSIPNNIPVSFSGTSNTGSYDFIIPGLGNSGTNCAKVNVLKDKSDPSKPMSVTITSNGYNLGDASCNSTNPNRVERELKISSFVGVPPATCNLPWGGSISNGASVTAYATSTVPYGSSCSSENRTCTNGSLSGTYQYQNCSAATAPIITWTGTTSGSQSMPTNSTLTFTTPGTYTITVNKTLAVGVGGAAGGGGGSSVCAPPTHHGPGGADGGGGGASTGSSLVSVTLSPSKSYQVVVGSGGVGGSSGGGGGAGGNTHLYNSTDGTYISRLQAGSTPWAGGVYVGLGVSGAQGGFGGWTYENGTAGGSQPTGAAGGGGSGGSCDWGVPGSGGAGGSGGSGVGGPGSSGGGGSVSCYNQTPGGGGGGWSYSGLPAYYGGGGGGAGACGNYGNAGSGGNGAFIFKAL